MKAIQHSVFAESKYAYSILSILSGVADQRTRSLERIRKRVEAFINEEIGVENVVSVTEHASTLGPVSVVVWWYRELPEIPDTATQAIRGSDESKTA